MLRPSKQKARNVCPITICYLLWCTFSHWSPNTHGAFLHSIIVVLLLLNIVLVSTGKLRDWRVASFLITLKLILTLLDEIQLLTFIGYSGLLPLCIQYVVSISNVCVNIWILLSLFYNTMVLGMIGWWVINRWLFSIQCFSCLSCKGDVSSLSRAPRKVQWFPCGT